ncbi:hypothetical protein ACWGR3_28960 [Streptomyces albidoflavus]
MATTRKPTPEPTPEYDFDNWTEEAEEKAIAALVPDVRWIIVEQNFIGRFVDGTIVKLPIRLSVDDIDELDAVAASPVDQLKHLLTKIGGADAAKEFTSHDIAEAMVLATKYFTVLRRVAGASLPE